MALAPDSHLAQLAKRRRRRWVGAAVLVASLLLAYALIVRGDTPGASFAVPDQTVRISLDITVIPTGNDKDMVLRREIRCPAQGEGHDDVTCSRLAALSREDLHVDREMTCSAQYGGPATALVDGMWGDRPVREHLKLTNGCEIKRWRELQRPLDLPTL
jgi:hypothetical protein